MTSSLFDAVDAAYLACCDAITVAVMPDHHKATFRQCASDAAQARDVAKLDALTQQVQRRQMAREA